MPREPVITTLHAYLARTQLGALLQQVRERRARFIVTKSGKPTAVLLGATDFDDIVEDLDPEFRKSLKVASKQHRAGKSLALRDYLKERLTRRGG